MTLVWALRDLQVVLILNNQLSKKGKSLKESFFIIYLNVAFQKVQHVRIGHSKQIGASIWPEKLQTAANYSCS